MGLDSVISVIEKNKVAVTVALYFMVRYCTVDGMVLETCKLSNIFCVGVFWHSVGLKMATGV